MEVWLSQSVRYDDTYRVEDVIDLMCQRVYTYATANPDLFVPMDYQSFFDRYAKMVFEGYQDRSSSSEATDYFDLAYEEDVLRLFQQTNELSEHYDIKSHSTSSDLHEFLRDTVDITIPLYEDEWT